MGPILDGLESDIRHHVQVCENRSAADVAHALRTPAEAVAPRIRVQRLQEAAALALALCSLLLAFAATESGPLSRELLSNPLAPKELPWLLATVAGGTVIALCLGRSLPELPGGAALAAIGSPIRRATVAIGGLFERADAASRQWHVAGISLLALTLLFGTAMFAA